jgi:hypothetical protein
MATITEAQQRAELKLETIELMLGDVPEVAAEWGAIPWGEAATDERLAWSMDWDNQIAALDSLACDVAAGLLTADQQCRYERLLGKLKEALPLIDALRLSRPRVPLDA